MMQDRGILSARQMLRVKIWSF